MGRDMESLVEYQERERFPQGFARKLCHRRLLISCAVFGLSLFSAIYCGMRLEQGMKDESIRQLNEDYDKCSCLLQDFRFVPYKDSHYVNPNPLVDMILYCPTSTFRVVNKQILTSNGDFIPSTNTNQTCYYPHDPTNTMTISVPQLQWTDAPHATPLIVGFTLGMFFGFFFLLSLLLVTGLER